MRPAVNVQVSATRFTGIKLNNLLTFFWSNGHRRNGDHWGKTDDMVFKKPMKLYFAEDNEAMIKICKSGHLSEMRHLSDRTR